MNFGLSSRLEMFLTGLNRSQQTASDAQQQLTTGIKIRSAADDPRQVEDLLLIQSGLVRAEQTAQNLGVLRAEVGAGASALQQGIRVLDSALSVGSQAASGVLTGERRTILVGELEALQARMVGLSATVANGRFVFSGDLDGAASYSLNLSNLNGVDRLSRPTYSLQAELPDGSRFPIGRTAQDLFDRRNPDDSLASENVFAALQMLRTAVAIGSDTDLTTALSRIKSSTEYLNTQAAGYEATQSRLIAAQSESEQAQAHWKVRLSEVRDADVAAAILQMQQVQTQMNATMSAQAQFPRSTLFDFLR